LPRETFSAVFYSFIGMYKIIVFVFNVVPWAVLAIIGGTKTEPAIPWRTSD